MPGFGKSTFAKKRRAKRLGSECSHCVRLTCKKPCCKTLGMVSVNHEDKIKFVKDDMSKVKYKCATQEGGELVF